MARRIRSVADRTPMGSWRDTRFVNECFDSLAANDPIYVKSSENVTCIEYLLNVSSKVRGDPSEHLATAGMYQFGRDDIDFTKPYCNDKDGNTIDCIARICEFHTSNVNHKSGVLEFSAVGSPKGTHPATVASENMRAFFNRYHDLIMGSQCETYESREFNTKEYSSCLNKLFELDPYLGHIYYPTKEDFEYTGCSVYIDDNRYEVPCLEKVIIGGLRSRSGTKYGSVTDIERRNANRILGDFLTHGDREYKFNNEMLVSHPDGDPLGYPTYIDLLTDLKVRVGDKESFTTNYSSPLIYSYLIGAAGHKYNVRGNIFDVQSNFCRDPESREMIPCLDKMLIESLRGYNESGSTYFSNVKDLVSNPYFKSKPCDLFAIVSKYTRKNQHTDTRGLDSGEAPGELLQAVAPTFEELLKSDATCPSRYTGDPVPIKEYGLELAVPVIAVTNIDKDVQNGKIFTGSCTSVDGSSQVTCFEKMAQMLYNDSETHGNKGASDANFALIDYAMRIPLRMSKVSLQNIVDNFNPVGVKIDTTFGENWGDLLDDIVQFRVKDMSGNMCSDGKSVLQHVIEDLGSMVDTNERFSVNQYTTTVSAIISSDTGLSDDEKKFVINDVFQKTEEEFALRTVSRWVNARKGFTDDLPDVDMCNILKSKSDWVSALVALEKRDRGEDRKSSDSAVMQGAYEKCFGVEYPKAFGYTTEARKIYDYLCFSELGLDSNQLVQDIIGIEPGNPDAMNSAYKLKKDVHDINGVYEVNTKEAWNEEDIEKYASEVSKVWYGSENKSYGLYHMFHYGSEYDNDYQPFITNVGTRDEPIKARLYMTMEPSPEMDYHALFNTVDGVRKRGDFEIILHYVYTEEYRKWDEITRFKKAIPFANIITDLPKGVRNHIIKHNQKLFNKMQNVANAIRVKKPSEGQYKLVISNKSADLARCTSCQPWEDKSCLNLEGGCYRAAVRTYAHYGSYVAYLVKDSPYEPQWLGRLLIHKCNSTVSGFGEKTVDTLSIQDEKQHYTTKPRYWGIVYDAVRTIFANKGINEGTAKDWCGHWAWHDANKILVGDYQDICDEAIDNMIREDHGGCVERCMENSDYDPDVEGSEDDARERCEEQCEDEIRGNFNCEDYLIGYFEEDDETPLYVSYSDTNTIQHIKPGDKEYNIILTHRVNDTSDSSKFVKKLESTF